MVHFSIQVQENDEGFVQVLDELKRKVSSLPGGKLLFHVYSTVFSPEKLAALTTRLNGQFPGCQILCCTVSGAVLKHEYRQSIVVSVKVLEYPDSRARVQMYDLAGSSDKAVAREIVRFVQDNPWVKAVELHRTVHDMNTSDLCSTLSELPEEIEIFGGLVSAENIGGSLSYITDGSGKVLDRGVLAVYYGGGDLHIKTYRMSGWKAIDKAFTVTKAERNVIREIDGAPAYEIYKRYLDIEPDDNFVLNVLEFPFLSEDQGHSVVRNVFSLEPDGGLTVAYSVNPGTKLKISYADTETVVEDIQHVSREVMGFTPDAISVVSCITRSIIWRMKEYMPELQGFQAVAPCHGYLSHGELIREKGFLDHHNTILVATAFREGAVRDVAYPGLSLDAGEAIPLAARLSTFISRVTEELGEMYAEVERTATTDALTRIGNRYLFDDAVTSASADVEHAGTKVLLMFDLNGLKFVNDTFGHNEGDMLIKAASEAISDAFSPYGQCFRIGGDEFAAIADFEDRQALEKALERFYDSLDAYNRTSMYTLSMAMGCAALINPQGKQLSGSDWKMAADISMYQDKARFHTIRPKASTHSMVDFIDCIMSLVDNKSSTFVYHSVRVQRMAIAIAQLMQVESEVMERVKSGAYLHDIGRVGIPDSVLERIDPLSDDDRMLRERLPAIGRRLLTTSEETKNVADIVYACFERWDGSGLPEALKGEQIPLEARIIAVADFVDVALHYRNDRAALSAEECIRQLQELSGSMFDPAVVAVVVPNFEQIIKGDIADTAI